MKGLFLKDLGLLKGQKYFFGSVLLMMVIFLTTYSNFTFVICYITIMFGILTLTTISYDDFQNGMGYLFTLPVSRKEYVGEKYLFSLSTTIPALLMVSALAFVTAHVRDIDFPVEEWMMGAIASFLIVTVVLSVLIPLQLKFGADKSRVAMMIVWGAGFLAAFLGVKVCDALDIDWRAGLEWVSRLKPAAALSGLAVICGVVMVISYLFSLRFLERREF